MTPEFDLMLSRRDFCRLSGAFLSRELLGINSPEQLGQKAKWGIYVYCMADNKDEAFFLHRALFELAKGGSIPGIAETVVFYDGYSDPNGPQEWNDGSKILYAGSLLWNALISENFGEVIENLGEADFGDPKTLSHFLTTADKTHPANNLLVIMDGHGGLWTGTGVDESTVDRDSLTLNEQTQSLEEIVLLRGKPFDVLYRPMCFSANLETFIRLKSVARVIIGNQAEVYCSEPSYNLLPGIIASNPDLSAEQLALQIIKTSYNGWDSEGSKLAIGVFQTEKFNLLDIEFRNAGNIFQAGLTSPQIREAMIKARKVTPYVADDYPKLIDGAEFCRNIREQTQVLNDSSLSSQERELKEKIIEQALQLEEAIVGTIIPGGIRIGSEYQGLRGMSICCPISSIQWKIIKNEYLEQTLQKEWGGFLDKLTPYLYPVEIRVEGATNRYNPNWWVVSDTNGNLFRNPDGSLYLGRFGFYGKGIYYLALQKGHQLVKIEGYTKKPGGIEQIEAPEGILRVYLPEGNNGPLVPLFVDNAEQDRFAFIEVTIK